MSVFSLQPFISRCRAAIRAVMDFLLPPLCLNCDCGVTENQTLCADCWKSIHFIASPLCVCCGAPFDLPVEEETLCGACLAHMPAYDAARSTLLYDDASKSLILRLKHADQLHPVPALASWMVRAGKFFWDEADMIVPVPLHRWRLLKRRYNQAAVLAQEIGKKTETSVVVDCLVRVRATATQGHKSRKERRANLAGAFELKAGQNIKDKSIILIDDVMTSGATVEACAKTLKKAGAARVYVVTLARTKIAR